MIQEKAIRPLILSNFDPATDLVIFNNDWGSWNVCRALRDCAAGKHRLYTDDVEACYAHNKKCETEPAKVRFFMRRPDILQLPLLGIIEDGKTWLIDGQHRLKAMHRLKRKTYRLYLIEEADAAPYRIWYNGQRLPPFKL